MSVRMGVASLAAAMVVATGASAARADVLELHGTVTQVASGRDAEVAVGQPVTVVVKLERQVPHQFSNDGEAVRVFAFEPTDDYQIRIVFDGTRLPPIEVPGTEFGVVHAQGFHTYLNGEAGRGGDVKVNLNFHSNVSNDTKMDPTLELTDWEFGQFFVHEGGTITIQGTFEWARSIRKELELLGDASSGLATANAGIESANEALASANAGINSANSGVVGLTTVLGDVDTALDGLSSSVAGLTTSTNGIATAVATLQASLDAVAQAQLNLRSAVSQVLANQEAILANQGVADRKLDRILRRLN